MIMNVDHLYQDITNAERLEVIREFPISEIVSAPGHTSLRNPDAVGSLIEGIECGRIDQLFHEPILIGIFIRKGDFGLCLRHIECLDGHHRLLAALVCAAWNQIGDLPPNSIDTRVNGWRAGGFGPEERWVPLDVVRRSRLNDQDWTEVSTERGAKGRTARISGTISSLDTVFVPADRGVPLGELAHEWVRRTASSAQTPRSPETR